MANGCDNNTAQLAPTVSLLASPSSIAYGGSSALSWVSTNTTECLADWTSKKTTSGNQTLTGLISSSTYTMTCTGGGGFCKWKCDSDRWDSSSGAYFTDISNIDFVCNGRRKYCNNKCLELSKLIYKLLGISSYFLEFYQCKRM